MINSVHPLGLLVTIGLCGVSARTLSQTDWVLRDSDGDGHPLFGGTSARPDHEFFGGHDPNGGHATDAAFRDLDGDGDLDAAFSVNDGRAGIATSYITVVRNSGDGVFGPPEAYLNHSLWQTCAVELGDLDGDGDLDIAAANAAVDSASILLNRGDGTYVEAITMSVGDQPRSLRGADFDGDGDIDLAVMNCLSNDVSILLNDGAGGFAPEVRASVGGVTQAVFLRLPIPGPALDAGDVDGDGDTDLAVPARTRVKLLLNDGAGSFTLATQHAAIVDSDAYHAILRDLDGDVDLDLAVAVTGRPPTGLSIALNLGDGVFGPPTAYAVSGCPTCADVYCSVDSGDLDRDGDPDLIVGSYQASTYTVLRAHGDGTFAPYELYDVQKGPWQVGLRDVSGDGWLDAAIVTQSIRSTLRVDLNDGAGTLLDQVREPGVDEGEVFCCPQQEAIAAADLDADGDQDLVLGTRDWEDGRHLHILLNDGNGHLAALPSISLGPTGQSTAVRVAIGDANGDGLPDIAAGDEVDLYAHMPGKVWVLTNLGDGEFADPVPYQLVREMPYDLHWEDMDGDGDRDLVVWGVEHHPGDDAIPVERVVMVMSNQGDGTLIQTGRVVLSRLPWPFPYGSVAVGDVDSDGDADAIATSSTRGVGFVHLLLNDGVGGLTLVWTWDIGPHTESAALADFDRDGDLDAIIGCNHNFAPPDGMGAEPLAALLRNDGSGNFTIDGLWYSDWVASESLITACLDSDHAVDLAIMDAFAGVHIGLNRDGAPQESLTGYATYQSVWDAAAADFNGDGRTDLALATSDSDGSVNILFNYGRFPCPPDLNDDGRLNLFDFLAFQTAFGHQSPDADFDHNGRLTMADFLAFQTAFGNGC